MTTPSDSPEPPDEGEPVPAQPSGPAEAVPAAPGTPPAPPPPARPAAPVGAPPGPAYLPAGEPFAPVVRAPRTPWVNPARRGHVAAAAIIGALIFGGGGLLIGHAVTDDGHNGGVIRFERGSQPGNPGYGRGQLPQRNGDPQHRLPGVPGAPTSAPSGSATS